MTPIPLSTPGVGRPPSATCVNGWVAPVLGSREFDDPLAALEAGMAVPGPWDVAQMRYFTGPASRDDRDLVERWYVRAALTDDPGFRGRCLIARPAAGAASIIAVAAWDSTGYRSPDWTAFKGDGPPQTYLGLPGAWRGTPYDFVSGAGGPGTAGLPSSVVGCVTG